MRTVHVPIAGAVDRPQPRGRSRPKPQPVAEPVEHRCLGCRAALEWHQPDPDRPERLLGTCPGCGRWHIRDVSPGGDGVVHALGPVAPETLEAPAPTAPPSSGRRPRRRPPLGPDLARR